MFHRFLSKRNFVLMVVVPVIGPVVVAFGPLAVAPFELVAVLGGFTVIRKLVVLQLGQTMR
jgi:hypothetical protein